MYIKTVIPPRDKQATLEKRGNAKYTRTQNSHATNTVKKLLLWCQQQLLSTECTSTRRCQQFCECAHANYLNKGPWRPHILSRVKFLAMSLFFACLCAWLKHLVLDHPNGLYPWNVGFNTFSTFFYMTKLLQFLSGPYFTIRIQGSLRMSRFLSLLTCSSDVCEMWWKLLEFLVSLSLRWPIFSVVVVGVTFT
jgi:hypothetical protein